MNDDEKLRVLIPHWIEHNADHAQEFRSWAKLAGPIAPEILAAADQMAQVNQILSVALEKLGGPRTYSA